MPAVQSGQPLTVERGAVIHLQAGAKLLVAEGASIGPEAGYQAAPIADVATGGSATAAANATAINSILAALRRAGIIATS